MNLTVDLTDDQNNRFFVCFFNKNLIVSQLHFSVFNTDINNIYSRKI